MSEEYRRFDPADYVRSEEGVLGLLRAAAEEDAGDGAVIRAALKHIAQTQNMSALARDTGLNRGNLYEALSEYGNPTLSTLLKVTSALGLSVCLEPAENLARDGTGSRHRSRPAGIDFYVAWRPPARGCGRPSQDQPAVVLGKEA